MSTLQDSIFATDRTAEVRIYINGVELLAGLGQQGNLKSLDVDFQIDQLPPTATVELVKIPGWVKRGMDIWIDAGFDGNLRRIFTGTVKRRRRSVNGETLDCVGKTAVLTSSYVVKPKAWVNQTAEFAVKDILDDLTPPFTDYDLDTSLSDIVLGSVKTAVLDLAPPSDMIHTIVDIDGHRMFETPTGTLVIRPLLEAPAPIGFRVYSTTPGNDTIVDTVDTYPETNIDTGLAIGDSATNTARGQGITLSASGVVVKVSVWLKKVGNPTDIVRLELRKDNGAGLPGQVIGGSIGFSGTFLDTTSYTKVEFSLPANPNVVMPSISSGDVVHLVISRSGAVDPNNYYVIGADSSTPTYTGGRASRFNGSTWSAVSGVAIAFEVVTRTYPALRILDISSDENADQIKKKVYVEGASIPSTDAEGNKTQKQVTAEAVTLSNDLVAGDPEYYSMKYQNPLIDTEEQAAKTALRLLNKYHRVLETVQLKVPFDPLVALGSTITLIDNDPVFGVTGKSGNWWVFAYKHSLSESDLVTELSLYGGDQSGTSGSLAPLADFKYIAERELIGAAEQVVITFSDDSKDLDGSIVNYRWVDDYAGGAMDISGPDRFIVTRVYNPAVDDEINVTLTVTDDQGLSRSVTKTIRLGASSEGAKEIYLPQLSCAAGNTCMYSPDGGITWVDRQTPSGVAKVTEMFLAPNPYDTPYIVFGTDNGRIYRTIDGNKSLSLVLDAGSQHPIVDITEAPFVPGMLWALTRTGRVYRTTDFGASWELYVDLGSGPVVRRKEGDPKASTEPFVDPTPCSKILASTPSVNRIWVFGGRGTDPATYVVTNYLPDGPDVWYSDIIPEAYPPLRSTGDSTDTVVDVVVSHGSSGDLGLLFKGRNNPSLGMTMYIYGPPVWHEWKTPWEEAVGLPAGVDGRAIAGNNLQLKLFMALLNNKNVYRTTDGFRWQELTDRLPGSANNRPNSLHNFTAWRDVFLSATNEGIAKTTDFGETWSFVRPNSAFGTGWPSGAIGYDISFEYLRPSAFKIIASVYDANANKTATILRDVATPWIRQSVDDVEYSVVRLYHFHGMGNVLFRVRKTNFSIYGFGEGFLPLQRSDDLGVTWVDTSVEGCSDVARAGNGYLYALGSGGDAQTHRVYLSTDNGVTWQEVYNDTVSANGKFTRYSRIAVDPNNFNRVIAVGWNERVIPPWRHVLLVSLNASLGAGATYSRLLPAMTENPARDNMGLVIGQEGRILVSYVGSGDLWVESNDQDGQGTWTTRLRRPKQNVAVYTMEFFRAGMDLYLMHPASGGVVRSRDNGQTWETFPDIPSPLSMAGLAWDAVNNTLYTGQDEGSEANTVLQMIDPSPTGVWIDRSAGIAAATGFARNKLCYEGLEILKT